MKSPKTLQEAIQHFSDYENCKEFMVAIRWTDGKVKCPQCGSAHVTYLEKARLWKCYSKHERAKFSLKTGTIFEESPIGLDKWLPVMWMLVNSRNGVSSWEIHRSMGVTQKTAWFMLQRARLAMQDDLTGGMLGGDVEVDETFIGGKARNMHKIRKVRAMQGKRGGADAGNKTIVLGILERETAGKPKRVRATVIPDRKKATIQPEITATVAPGAALHSDELGNTWRMDDQYVHNIVQHLETYVEGNVHTNTLENFWSLLKRGLGGTYISVEPFHLFRYVDEQAFRFNNRNATDAERFQSVMSQIVGRRLTYQGLIGKTEEGPSPEPF